MGIVCEAKDLPMLGGIDPFALILFIKSPGLQIDLEDCKLYVDSHNLTPVLRAGPPR